MMNRRGIKCKWNGGEMRWENVFIGQPCEFETERGSSDRMSKGSCK